jgi:hypothetical protein
MYMVNVDMDVEEDVWINGAMTLINISKDEQRGNKWDDAFVYEDAFAAAGWTCNNKP